MPSFLFGEPKRREGASCETFSPTFSPFLVKVNLEMSWTSNCWKKGWKCFTPKRPTSARQFVFVSHFLRFSCVWPWCPRFLPPHHDVWDFHHVILIPRSLRFSPFGAYISQRPTLLLFSPLCHSSSWPLRLCGLLLHSWYFFFCSLKFMLLSVFVSLLSLYLHIWTCVCYLLSIVSISFPY